MANGDEYIVVLKSGVRESVAGELSAANDLDVRHRYTKALQGFSARGVSEQALGKLRADPRVSYVEEVRTVRSDALRADISPDVIREGVEWGLDRIDRRRELDLKYKYADDGRNVTAYVIDSGIRTSHAEFRKDDGVTSRAEAPVDFIDNQAPGQDEQGHGTHVAALIAGRTYGVAPAARVVGVRVLDGEGLGQTADVVAGLNWVAANAVRPAVVNLSLGAQASQVIDDAVRNVIASGITVVASAGNDGADASTKSPARVGEAITVGATNRNDVRPWWSNTGPVVDLHAPGVEIRSAYKSTDLSTISYSGTSQAAPFVAGTVARFLERHPVASPAEVQAAIVRNATNANIAQEPAPPVTPPGEDPPGGAPIPPQLPGPPPEPLSTEATTNKLLHASINGQPSSSCSLSATNNSDNPIPDSGSVSSAGAAGGCGGVGIYGEVKVLYDIAHSRPSDLKVELVAPDGTVTLIRPAGTLGSSSGVTTYTSLNEPSRDGQWKLRVTDTQQGTVGTLLGWTLRF
ncbi:S8 family serine peptidase [Streptomyces cinereoruber]|uniref:S8 family serine peptidase n=1 Tax=Streptomyces cinereoruber TaxID=67260 RepID=UPI00362B39A5